MSPGKVSPDDRLHDQVVRPRCRSDSDAEVDLPFGGDVQVRDSEDLLLLVVQGIETSDAPVVGVVLYSAADLFRKVIADLASGSEADALCDIRAMPGSLKRRIHSEIPPSQLFVDDRPNLPGPCVGRVHRPLIADLGRDADPNRPMPRVRSPDSGANVITNPLDSVSVLLTGENIEPHLGP